jgi:hypothetical protein
MLRRSPTSVLLHAADFAALRIELRRWNELPCEDGVERVAQILRGRGTLAFGGAEV